jgi:hypothetical protein
MKIEDDHAYAPGSAPVWGVGDGVSPSQAFLGANLIDNPSYSCRRLPHFEKPWAIYAVTIGTKSRKFAALRQRGQRARGTRYPILGWQHTV